MLFAHVTTRIPDEPYDSLLRALGGRFFPTILYLDESGKVLGEHDVYRPRTTEEFERSFSELKAMLALREKKERTKAEVVDLLRYEILLNVKDYEDAKEARAALGELPPEQAAKVDPLLANLEAEDLMDPVPRSPEASAELGGELREMADAGRVPSAPRTAFRFWGYQLTWAEANGNLAVAGECMAGLRKAAEEDERLKRSLPRFEKTLEKIRAAAAK